MADRQKVIVIGAGFGGLSAAARLAAQGFAVQLFDKRDKLGGRGYQMEINGFKFDSGPTVITAPYMFDEIWSQAGRDYRDYFELVPLDPFYRIFNHRGEHFDYFHQIEDVLTEIDRWNPEDKAGYQRFVEHTVRIFEKFHPSTDKPFQHLSAMMKIMPDVIRMGLFQSMYGYTSRFIKNEFLRRVFSFHPLLVGGSPMDTPSIYGLIIQFEREWGVHYAIGGTGAIVAGFGRLLEELGVDIHLNAEISEITIDKGRATGVRLADGTTHTADIVVCNGDAAHTYHNLIPQAQRSPVISTRLKTMSYSNSLFVIYFGTKRRYLDSKLSHHNIMIGDDYKRQLRAIFNQRQLPDELSLYLHMPSITDPTIAPEGCESFYVLALVPNLDADIDWTTFAPTFRDQVLDYLEANYLPELRENIVALHHIDPLHFQNTLNSYKGAAFAAKPTLIQSAWLRPHPRSDQFDNLYFCGASTHPGAGVPAVLASGKIAANMIAEQHGAANHTLPAQSIKSANHV